MSTRSAPAMFDDLWTDARLVTMRGDGLGVIEPGALAVKDGVIAWIGPMSDLPATGAKRRHDAGGRFVLPGFVDAHTHLVFAGDRVGEFERQLGGATRKELAAEGGGILYTMRETRKAPVEELVAIARPRLRRLMSEGVTTLEIKSGYGLDLDSELNMLRAARRLGRENGIRVVTSFLGAHVVPPEFAGRSRDYLTHLAEVILPAALAEGLVDICDGGIEGLSIQPEEMMILYRAALNAGLPVKGHTDQYGDVGGAGQLAALGALSADHLEYSSEASITAMAKAGTVAMLLPGSTLFLNEPRRPPLDLFRRHGVAMALATNCNPGSSPTLSPLLVLALGCSLFRMTPVEALRGYTVVGARAAGLAGKVGELRVGLPAEFVLWEIGQPAELCYWLGGAPPREIVSGRSGI
ncbi:imidazolonepropionase [Roseococcus sp. SYP-B2431]|uniref:imidazolonepropionase n=1 Tax=Roseococcus sp. SYP-B2431 TaxID=2496640 RepID=UPI001F118521|nr:imidazolonepropionase [Roseococcus sp. SYP-B2431]